MATNAFYPYRAFLSYSHRDQAWCDRVHRALERYRFDNDLVGRDTVAGPVPPRLAPVFRDRADFASGPLQAQTAEALKASQFLVVLASPASAASDYVNQEISEFKRHAGEARVLALILEGAPPDCFAPALRFQVDGEGKLTDAAADVVAADVLKDGEREALVKLIAGLSGLPYDILWQRDVKAARRRVAYLAGVGVVAMAALAGMGGVLLMHRDAVTGNQKIEAQLQEGAKKQDELKQLLLASASGAPTKALAGIRDLLRPGNPGIDAIPDEQLPKLVQGVLEDLRKPAAKPDDLSGAGARVLQQAQAQTANLQFADAAKTLDAEIAKTEAEDQTRAKSRAALLAERGRVARLQLRYREAAGFYQKAAAAVAFDSKAQWDYSMRAAGALTAQGDEFGDNAALHDAIAAYRTALSLAPRERVPFDWAQTQNNLGNALETLGERESGPETLQKAVTAYGEALKERTRERVPLDWAQTQNNLGNVLLSLGERESGTETLQKAVTAYGEALKERTRERVPLDWAQTQNNLGVVLWRLGERERGMETLQKAVAAYGEALKERTRERVPLDWAQTQNNLGVVLWRLGERERGMETLQEAAAAFGEALKEWTRERVPLDWAQTQNNLGVVLWRLGERERGMETLQKAVAAYGEALKERTRERVPLDWAKTQNNLGNALETLGERESGTETLQKAAAAFGEALKEQTRKRVPLDWAQTQNNLGNALARLGERESGTATLQKAVAAFGEALKERTRERVPLDWATTQNNLGAALESLGERESGTESLQIAVAAFGEALREWTRERVPLNWATTQNNLGNALARLGERESGTATLQKAVAAFGEALKERTRQRVPLIWAQTQNNLASTLQTLGDRHAKQGDLGEAHVAYARAVDTLGDLLRAADPADPSTSRTVAGRLGNLAYHALLAKDFSLALGASDLALGADASPLWLLTNKAHALMLLHRADEARAIYLAHRGERVDDKRTWEADVLEDFAQLRGAGLSDPLMDEIAAAFAAQGGK